MPCFVLIPLTMGHQWTLFLSTDVGSGNLTWDFITTDKCHLIASQLVYTKTAKGEGSMSPVKITEPFIHILTGPFSHCIETTSMNYTDITVNMTCLKWLCEYCPALGLKAPLIGLLQSGSRTCIYINYLWMKSIIYVCCFSFLTKSTVIDRYFKAVLQVDVDLMHERVCRTLVSYLSIILFPWHSKAGFHLFQHYICQFP